MVKTSTEDFDYRIELTWDSRVVRVGRILGTLALWRWVWGWKDVAMKNIIAIGL